MLVRTDAKLTIGSKTYYPADFSDGVIPEYVYVLCVGGGGGGGGTPGGAGKGAGGGGAGGRF
jgi:hypothetical protein